MSPPEHANLIPGTTVGGFRVEEFVGAGAMAVVYRATQINLDRSVALKILPGNFSRSRDYVDRFFNEARAAAAFSHPNIVRAYDAGIDENDVCYFAMEFIEGETVLDRIEREGRLPLLDGLQVALGIAEALDYGWHEHRLTHGDIKPANLMINQRGETKLADFGLAKVAEIEDVEGSIMLTPLYASPEIIQGYQPKEDCRPDIYSFGATLYHMLSGAPPFPGEDSKEVMRLQVEKPLPPLRKQCPGIPQHVSDFVSLLLNKDPEKRAQSWAEVVEGLETSLELMTRKGALVTATATAPKVSAAGLPQQARAAKRAKKRLSHHTSPRKNALSAVMISAFTLIALAIVAAIVAIFVVLNQAAKPPVDPAGSDVKLPTAQIPQLPKRIPRNKLNRELSAQPGPAERLKILKKYLLDAEIDSDKRMLHNQIQKEKKKLAEEKARGQALEENPPKPKPNPDNVPEDPAPTEKESEKLLNQSLDDYTDVAFAVASHELSFNSPPVSINELIIAWQGKYPQDKPPAEKVDFLATVILPAHMRLRSHLIDNQELFKDLKIPGKENRIINLSSGGIDTSVALDSGGEVRTRLNWADISSPPIVKAFVKKLLSKNDITNDELRAALSCMALEGAVSAVANSSGKLPEVEQKLWVSVTTDLANAEAEKIALAKLIQAEKAAQKKVFLTAHGLTKDVLSSGTTIPLRYKDRIDKVMTEVLPHTPEHQLEKMADQAENMVVTNPREALSLAVMSLGKYGRLNSSATTRFKQVTERAVRQIATKIQLGSGINHFDSQFKPFTTATLTREKYGESLGVIQLYSQFKAFPENVVFYQNALYTTAWLASAYWEKAVNASPLAPPERASTLPDSHKYFLNYADALITARTNPQRVLLEKHLLKLDEFTSGDVQSLSQAILSMHYAFITETSDLAGRLTWPEVTASIFDISVAQDYVLTLAGLCLTNRDTEAASEIIKTSLRFLQFGFQETDDDFNPVVREKNRMLRWLLVRLNGAPPGPDGYGRNPPYEELNNSPGGRWILYQLYSQNLLSQDERKDIAVRITRKEYLYSILDARRLFENLLLTTATYLTAGDLDRAIKATDTVLGHDSPFLVEYYPRVLALKAGLLMADKQWTAARETLMMIQLCSTASKSEQQWVGYFSAPPSSRVSKAVKASSASLTDYWDGWLNYCYWKGAENTKMAKRESALLQSVSTNGVKRALAKCVFDYTAPNKN